MKYEVGNVVKVRTFMDGVVSRRVVGETVATVYLCNESEFQSAQAEDREPISIGFPIVDIVENADEDNN